MSVFLGIKHKARRSQNLGVSNGSFLEQYIKESYFSVNNYSGRYEQTSKKLVN
jgi:hypothetical protein